MTRKVRFIAIALFACALSARAEPLPSPPDLELFLTSLRSSQPVARSESPNAYCEVTLHCDAVPQYGSVFCYSYNSDCHAGSNWVECDGVRQYCPTCYRQCPCQDEECFGWSSCATLVAPRRIVCDGATYYCAPLSSCF